MRRRVLGLLSAAPIRKLCHEEKKQSEEIRKEAWQEPRARYEIGGITGTYTGLSRHIGGLGGFIFALWHNGKCNLECTDIW